ncbi:tetracycline resistance MFS efflux pump [Staphylococcus hyicus]|uniref:Quinolone resistance protein NorB n=1 Tax=Staphylococcus hyicus TaxID=1284 RepID=A0A0A8HM11_STAHY|nr:tetracycline resistance MFS efflux pump [Staphylococcus hyicus]AJC94967.1 major facilitator transporter [Staphylococcus hyicus]MCE5154309.1 tetracycline resistance MFS efflux pump [Staphylococcus hyicus]MCQ9291506.1 tetracycline resistance MFS efflux pump [Staphylococcus hyicus]MCQ9306747.1 tetracycline resistance MFS efflux pump [Staphylococcus hyicus]MCQ9309614.1 tetracycline resistance MFS efflux pump [Staphylococcus hyicus]
MMDYVKVKRAVPILLFLFVFSLVIDNSFKLISVAIADDLNISVTTVSWQATLAGLVIGIGAVVYASLSDAISIRTLFIYGVFLIIIGSIIGYIFQHQFALVLAGRIIQTAGLAAAETLYVIYVAKYLSKDDQKTYLGLSTSSYSLSLVIGTLSGGFISTYLHWTNMFLIALIVIFTLPFLFKLLPKENNTNKAHLDFIGLILVATIATTVMLFITNFNWLYMIGALIAIAVFALYIKNAKHPLVDKSFFQNKRYASFLFIVFVMYAIQLGYIFTFPFIMQQIYHFELDTTSLLLIPGYLVAVVTGALSGKIGNYLTSKQATITAIVLIALSLFLPSFTVGQHVSIFVISMIFFAGSFALMYAPLLNETIRTIDIHMTGVAIGFYNLIINVAVSVGIAIAAALIDLKALNFPGNNAVETHFGVILFILGLMSLVGLALFIILNRWTKSEVSKES